MEKQIRTNNGQKRVMAFCIDCLFLAGIYLLSTGISQYLGPGLSWVVCSLAWLLYLLIPLSIFGQTLGKRLNKIKVVDLDDNELPKLKIIIRDFFKYFISVLTFGIYPIVSGIIVMSRDDEMSPHDFLFKCHVIDTTLKAKIEEKKYHEEEGFRL